jgi:hypothetical protein
MSVFSTKEPRRRLPDQVTIEFGPSELLGRAFLVLDRTVRQRGVYLSISDDMSKLGEANLDNRKNWYALPPMFDATLGGVNRDNSFWISGTNEHGEIVMAHACRHYYWPDTSLADEMQSMRFFYPNPETQAAGEECIVDSEPPTRLTGRVCYSGAMWVRPDYRGQNLAHIAPRLTRAYALTKWYPDYIMGLVNTKDASGYKAAQTYGWPKYGAGIRLRAKKYGEINFAYGWFDRDDIIDDLSGYTALLDSPAGELVV